MLECPQLGTSDPGNVRDRSRHLALGRSIDCEKEWVSQVYSAWEFKESHPSHVASVTERSSELACRENKIGEAFETTAHASTRVLVHIFESSHTRLEETTIRRSSV